MPKFDLNKVKQVCNYLQDHLEIDEDGDFIEINLNEVIPFREELAEITDGEVIFIVKQLASADCIKTKTWVAENRPRIQEITPKGYNLINSLNEPKIFNKLKDIAVSSIPSVLSFLLKA